ncbi:MAG: sigma-70 family RNA polymerase sigma factor [Acidobacteria bacterium]|nr:sigma-70 family RNA polymerase sigma factor [Acidobacteriota bacterium]
MPEEPIRELLLRFSCLDAREAWADFLREYSSLILQVIRHFETEPDRVSDCYLFACEQLCRDEFQRLRRFRVDGPARFSTWLRAVVRNLCFDWHRHETGREWVFDSVSALAQVDQDVFRLVFEQGASEEDAFLKLSAHFPGWTRLQLSESVERISSVLTTRQRWLLRVRHNRFVEERVPVEASAEEEDHRVEQLPDGVPNPESRAIQEEQRHRLQRAVGHLSPGDQLLLQMRYEQDLTLEQVARVLGLENAQAADRKIREVLQRLREDVE